MPTSTFVAWELWPNDTCLISTDRPAVRYMAVFRLTAWSLSGTWHQTALQASWQETNRRKDMRPSGSKSSHRIRRRKQLLRRRLRPVDASSTCLRRDTSSPGSNDYRGEALTFWKPKN